MRRTTAGATRSTDGSSTSPTARSSSACPTTSASRRCGVDTWGGFVFVNLDPDAEPLLDFLDPLPALLAPYHLEQMRLRASLTTIIDANWKAVVDAFNEGYHVQGLHRQILPWTDDVEHRVRAVRQARALRPAARRAASAAAEPASRPRPRRLRRRRDPRQPRRRSRRRVPRRGARCDRSVARDGPAARLDVARGVPGPAHAAAATARLRRVGSRRAS